MKFAILVADGMSDRPLEELGCKTPLEAAKVPNMTELAKWGMVGTTSTIPRGMPSASDVANLAILGYDPKKYYSGRGPLEAANLGIDLKENDVAFRCNLISANGDTLSDYSAGHITDKESKLLMEFLQEKLGDRQIRFYHGTSYRNLAVVTAESRDEAQELQALKCDPPHNIMGESITKHLPRGKGAGRIAAWMARSRELLEKSEINRVRIDLKENPATMIWLWGQGVRPLLPSYKETFGLSGSMISAVDLLKGIGRLIGLDVIDVPGATGYYDTNYKGKGEAAVESLKKKDFVFVHVEAPDEAGHNGDMRAKIEAIESFDRFIVGPVWECLKDTNAFRILVMPDHATPLAIRTHVEDPVPFAMVGRGIAASGSIGFCEKTARAGVVHKTGHGLTQFFLTKDL